MFRLDYERLDSTNPVDRLALVLLSRLACFALGEPVARDILLLTVDGGNSDIDSTTALQRLADCGLRNLQQDGGFVLQRPVAASVLALPGATEAQAVVEEALCREANRLNGIRTPALLLPWREHLRHVTDTALMREDLRAGRLCNELGYHLQQVGELVAARPYFEQALAITRQDLGEAHPETAICFNNLGTLLQDMDDLSAARPHLEQALAITERNLGSDHPTTQLVRETLEILLDELATSAASN